MQHFNIFCFAQIVGFKS